MLTQVIVLSLLLTSPITISLLVLWSAHRGYMANAGQNPGA